MGKGQKKRQSQTAARNHQSRTIIGRPEDDKFQTFFMKKLRNGKLQVITAQSQAQIACYNSIDNKLNEGEINSKQKVSYIKRWFQQIDSSRFKLLWKGFLRAAEKWQFKEINSISDFPEYLFCDECDLPYVLFQILNSDIPVLKQKQQFYNDQLVYLQLLCFATRDQVSFKIIRSIERNFKMFIDKMDSVKKEVIKYSKEIVRDEKNQVSPSEDEHEIPQNLRKGDVINKLSKLGQQKQIFDKTKQIQKKDKNDKKRGRPKKPNYLKQQEILDQSFLQNVSQKLIAHIIRAYAYIYPSQMQKKGEEQGQQQKKNQAAED